MSDSEEQPRETNPSVTLQPRASDLGVMRARWSVIALSLAVLSLGLFATLVVVVAIDNADTLSAVALALALVSFTAQLIVTLVQAQQSGSQLAETVRISTDMRATLGEISGQTNGLLASHESVVTRLLDLLPGAVSRAVEGAVSSEEPGGSASVDMNAIEEQVRTSLLAQLEEQALATPASAVTVVRRVRVDSSAFVSAVTTYPEDGPEAREALDLLWSLDGYAVGWLVRRTYEDLDRARSGRQLGSPWKELPKPDSTTGLLLARGLFAFTPTSDGYRRTLTPLGILVASLVLGRPESPRWLSEALKHRRGLT